MKSGDTTTAYESLKIRCQSLCQQPTPDTSTTFNVTPKIAVTWRWDSYTHGELYIDMTSPRPLDTDTLVHLAQVALPCTKKYQGIVVVDQRRSCLKLVRAGLKPVVDDLMEALELLLMMHDVLEALLIDGPIRPMRYI